MMGIGLNLKPNGVQGPNTHRTSRNGTLATENDTRYVIDIDIGGTYTDAIVSHGGGAAYFKTDTTPSDLSLCFEDALQKGAVQMGFSNIGLFLRKILVIRLSTSLSTNTLLERKGERVGLLLTKGRSAEYLDRFHTPEMNGISCFRIWSKKSENAYRMKISGKKHIRSWRRELPQWLYVWMGLLVFQKEKNG